MIKSVTSFQFTLQDLIAWAIIDDTFILIIPLTYGLSEYSKNGRLCNNFLFKIPRAH